MTGRPVPSEHGTTAYQRYHKCKCEPCRTAIRNYRKRLALSRHRGQERMVSAEPARAHIQALIEAGASTHSIAMATDNKVVRSQIRRLVEGVAQRLHKATAERILAVTMHEALAPNRLVSACGVQRRIQALNAQGFTNAVLAQHLGLNTDTVYQYCISEHAFTRTVDQINELYEELADQDGGNETVRWRAIREGWPPPLAWEEGTIDDPGAEPHWEWVRCLGARCAKPVHRQGLCKSHHETMQRHGGLRNSREFRRVVQTHCDTAPQDKALLLSEIGELKALGLTSDQVALRLGSGKSYIDKLWSAA